MSIKDKQIYKESFLYLFGSIIVAILGFVISLLYSYFFSPEAYGAHSLASSTYMLISQIFGLWLSTAVLRFHQNYKNNNKDKEFYASMYITQFFLSIIFLLLFVLIDVFILKEKLFKIIFLIYAFVYFFEYNILIINSMIRSKNMVKQYNSNVSVNNLLKIILLLLLYFVFGIKSIYTIVLSILLTDFIQFIYLSFKYKIYHFFRIKLFDYNILKEVFLYSFPLIGTTITSWILNVSDRYAIKILSNPYDVGLYSYAYLLGNNLFWFLTNFIMLGSAPNFVKLFEEDKIDELKDVFVKYINLFLLILIPCCFGIIGVSKNVFIAITSPMYHESYNVFIFTGIAITLLGLSKFPNKIFELYRKTKIIFILNLGCAIFNIILNFILIYHLGYVGGAISTLLSYLLYFIIANIISRKFIKINWNIIKIFKYIIASMTMLVIILFLNYIFIFENIYLKLAVQILGGMITYFVMLFSLGEISMSHIDILMAFIKKKLKLVF